MFGYRKEKSTGNVIDYWDLSAKPADTDEYEFVECAEVDKPECYARPETTEEAISRIKSELFEIDIKSIRSLREGDQDYIDLYESQALLKRSALQTLLGGE